MLFICQTYPYLRIYDPETEDFLQFQGGKLQLDPGERGFEAVKAEALRNPAITMLTEAVQCPECGEPFTGKAAGAHLGKHRKEAHFDKWVADKQAEQEVQTREVKGRQPHACDLCPRVQEFGSADELAIHVRAVHLTVDVDDNGNVFGDEGGGPASAIIAEPSAAR